ncbi:MAG TPA: DUF5343 domain-containing protein [Blastocatellia bacterium]|nr:DUF5343 domain-containing protein [Blastocatellia bacterium]
MPLPDNYTQKPGSIPAYFDAILDAQPPDRFSIRFLENLGFASTNDRLLIGILKSLGFLNADGAPQQRYFDFLDRSRSQQVLADAIREAYADLFAVNTKAYELAPEEIKNKLRTLYAGKKADKIIDKIAKTFAALSEYADFTRQGAVKSTTERMTAEGPTRDALEVEKEEHARRIATVGGAVTLDSLQYHINIILPDTRDQAVYDAIFRSLRDHLGTRHG